MPPFRVMNAFPHGSLMILLRAILPTVRGMTPLGGLFLLSLLVEMGRSIS
jgi:hypothetical protein